MKATEWVRYWMWKTRREPSPWRTRAFLLTNAALRLVGVRALSKRADALIDDLPWGNPPDFSGRETCGRRKHAVLTMARARPGGRLFDAKWADNESRRKEKSRVFSLGGVETTITTWD